jgi:hypothetical protein
MFSYSGKQLVWASSRNGEDEHDLNLFIADWIEDPKQAAGLSSLSLAVFFVSVFVSLL